MGSQIFSTYTSNASLTDSEDDYADGFDDLKESDETVKIEQIYDIKVPWCLKIIPHLLFLATVMSAVYGGALLLQFIEPATAKSPFINVVLNCFDAGARLGWGTTPPISPQGRIFVTIYTVCIVGLVNGYIATIGSIMTDVYCVHWPVLMAKLKGKDPKAHDLGRIMSLKVLFYFNVCMIGIGWYLWCYQFQKINIVDVTYFSVMTMMAAAFGDAHPSPQDHFQLIVLMIYFLIGIAVWSGILVILSSYFNLYFDVKFREYLRLWWFKYRTYKERKNNRKCNHNCVCPNDAA